MADQNDIDLLLQARRSPERDESGAVLCPGCKTWQCFTEQRMGDARCLRAQLTRERQRIADLEQQLNAANEARRAAETRAERAENMTAAGHWRDLCRSAESRLAQAEQARRALEDRIDAALAECDSVSRDSQWPRSLSVPAAAERIGAKLEPAPDLAAAPRCECDMEHGHDLKDCPYHGDAAVAAELAAADRTGEAGREQPYDPLESEIGTAEEAAPFAALTTLALNAASPPPPPDNRDEAEQK